MVSFNILAGGYNPFIAAYSFDSVHSSLSLLNKFPTGDNPSWVTLHPTNCSILYAVNENTDGALQSFEISPGPILSAAVSTVSSGGDGPAFTAPLSTGEVAILNYGSGSGRIIPTLPSSPLLFDDSAKSASLITFPPPPPPNVSHPHEAVEYLSEVLVPDLGGGKIWRLARDNPSDKDSSYQIQGFIEQPYNSGPRHIAISDDRLFILHELASTLTVQRVPSAPNGTSPIIDSVCIIPPDPPAGASFAAAEILIPPVSPSFPNSYIYVSNRNVGTPDPRGDTIAIYELVNEDNSGGEKLQLINQVYTGLNQPRGMAIGPAYIEGADEYLVAAGVQGTAGVRVFRRIEQGRDLELVAENVEIPTASSFVFV